jgi:hypothetical protein
MTGRLTVVSVLNRATIFFFSFSRLDLLVTGLDQDDDVTAQIHHSRRLSFFVGNNNNDICNNNVEGTHNNLKAVAGNFMFSSNYL